MNTLEEQVDDTIRTCCGWATTNFYLRIFSTKPFEFFQHTLAIVQEREEAILPASTSRLQVRLLCKKINPLIEEASLELALTSPYTYIREYRKYYEGQRTKTGSK